MQLKRYEARSISEAMAKIKNDLGSDAIVLSTRRVKGEKLNPIEVIAARDDAHEIIEEKKVEGGEKGKSEIFSVIRSDIDELKSLMMDFKEERGIYTDLAEIKETLNALFDVFDVRKNGIVSSHLSKVYYHLLSAGISKKQVCELIKRLQDNYSPQDMEDYHHALSTVEDMMKETIASSYSRQETKRISAFVGPAGEGKTTTLAKLAARYLFEKRLKVGIITMDTYRIGAARQLKTYADIAGAPLKIAAGKEEFKRSLDEFADKDVVLVDTPGKSLRDERYLLNLKECFAGLPLETNLVLSMTSSQESMTAAATRFEIAGYDRIIFTKLDDSQSFGFIYDIISRVCKPVPYITNGQNVPEDIQEIDPGRLARLIVNSKMSESVFAISN